MLALAERDWTIEDLVSFRRYIGIEVPVARRVRPNAGHLRDSHVSAPSMSFPIARSYAPGLVIDYEVSHRSLHLAEVRFWEMVPFLWQVIVDRGCLVREDCLQSATSFQRLIVTLFLPARHLRGNVQTL